MNRHPSKTTPRCITKAEAMRSEQIMAENMKIWLIDMWILAKFGTDRIEWRQSCAE